MNRQTRKKRNDGSGADVPWMEYCRYPNALNAGNTIELLVDADQAYPAMLEAIDRAERTVLMDSYIFHDDAAGKLFSDALTKSARRGILVYLIVDGVGTLHVPADFFTTMEREGVNVLVYRSPAPWRRSFGILRRDHRKLLVVDGRIGFAGGLNIGREWLSTEVGGHGWHDIHIRVEGPAVRELAKLPVATWRIHAGIELDQKTFLPEVESAGSEHVNIIGSRERKKRKAIRQSYLQAIRNAKEYIYIANAYFLPDLGFRRALKNACKRGVDVRVMVPERGDILPVQLASEALFGRLIRVGIRIFRWKEAVLHAKTAVIDGQWATVGSFNIDHRSWTMNLEVNVNSVGPVLSTRLRNVFLADQNCCSELTREEWRRRSWFTRLVQRFCYQFR
ncbi:MAG: cardiolipin synthase B, partial [Deltaproteobacteria bacterium]|nr:cardiolipin synthase B [Deltaproteobacteria bacterium]